MADRPAETRQTYGFIRAIGAARRLVHRSRPVRIPDANVDSDRAVEPCWPATFGSRTVERTDTRELASEATPSGAIEVPTSGQPVIFLRDQPVTGGYPVIAVLEPESLDVAGQLPLGACVRFHVVSAHATSTPQPAYPTKEVR